MGGAKAKGAAPRTPGTPCPTSDDFLITEVLEERGIKKPVLEPTAERVSGLVDDPPPVRTEYRPKYGSAASRPQTLEKPFAGAKLALSIGLLMWLGAFFLVPPAPCAVPDLGPNYADQPVFGLIAADELYATRTQDEYLAVLDGFKYDAERVNASRAAAKAKKEAALAAAAPAADAAEKCVDEACPAAEAEPATDAAAAAAETSMAPVPSSADADEAICEGLEKAKYDNWRRFTMQGYFMMSIGLVIVMVTVGWVTVRALHVMPNFSPFLYAGVGLCGVAVTATIMAAFMFASILRAPTTYDKSYFVYKAAYYTRYFALGAALLILAQLPAHHHTPPKDHRNPRANVEPSIFFTNAAPLLSMPIVFLAVAVFIPAVYGGKVMWFATALGLSLGLLPLTQEFQFLYRRPITREEALEFMTGSPDEP